MSDGDKYEVCCSCGTEFLQRAMRQVTASGLFMCLRCEARDEGEAYPEDELDDYEPNNDGGDQ